MGWRWGGVCVCAGGAWAASQHPNAKPQTPVPTPWVAFHRLRAPRPHGPLIGTPRAPPRPATPARPSPPLARMRYIRRAVPYLLDDVKVALVWSIGRSQGETCGEADHDTQHTRRHGRASERGEAGGQGQGAAGGPGEGGGRQEGVRGCACVAQKSAVTET